MPILEVKNLSKHFGGLSAVDDLSFCVPAGQVLGIIGPNGAGKTTTFNLISGLLKADSGSILFNGEEINNYPSWKRVRMGLARTYQIAQPFPELTVRENIMTGIIFSNSNSDVKAGSFALELCRQVGLEDLIDCLPTQLTNAQLKKMEIARALGCRPRLLLLDEPMEGLTSQEQKEAVKLVRDIQNTGVTVIIIEHVMQVIRDICQWVVVMDYGRKLVEGNFETVANHPQVIEAYLGREEEANDEA